jgi:hypothetical protein
MVHNTQYPVTALSASLARLADKPLLSAAARYLSGHAARINVELGRRVLADIPAFTASANPDILPELAAHGPEHTTEIIRLLRGGPIGDFEFVAAHARRRADQRFPLEATLHAYRCGHKVFSSWIREAILSCVSSAADVPEMVAAVADFTIEYTDVISTVMTSAYVSQTRLLADVAGDHRARLLSILLDGYDESDGRVSKILRDAGYLDGRQSFCVVLAQSVDPAEMQNPARARRLAESVQKVVQGTRARCLADIRQDRVTSVFSDARRASGWTAPRVALAKRVSADLSILGNAVLVGISNDVPSTSQIPGAHREALHALEMADVSRRVVQFSEVSTRSLLLHLAGEEVQRLTPAWTDALAVTNDKLGGTLTATLRAYARADMNVLKTGEILTVHPNTVYARLHKVLDLTGLDPRSYDGLTELLIVIDSHGRAFG